MAEEPTPVPGLEARFKQLAAYVSPADWDRLIGTTSERLMRRLAALGLFDSASPDQVKQGLEVVGLALVDFTNVAITSIAEGEIGQEKQS